MLYSGHIAKHNDCSPRSIKFKSPSESKKKNKMSRNKSNYRGCIQLCGANKVRK